MCWRSGWLCSALIMTEVSSTNLRYRVGGYVWAGTKGFYINLFHEQVCYKGTNGETHSSTLDLFIKLTLEEEVCVFKAELQKGNYVLNGHAGLLW